jgi:hypothetical protein
MIMKAPHRPVDQNDESHRRGNHERPKKIHQETHLSLMRAGFPIGGHVFSLGEVPESASGFSPNGRTSFEPMNHDQPDDPYWPGRGNRFSLSMNRLRFMAPMCIPFWMSKLSMNPENIQPSTFNFQP